MDILKVWKSKTLAFGWAVAILPALYENADLLREVLPAKYGSGVVSAIGIAVVLLRAATTKPISEK